MPNPYNYINLSYLESITEGSEELIKELITIFIDQIPEFRDGLEESYNKKDWSQIGAIAHKAKSSVISMGMDELGNTDLKNLELLAKLLHLEAIEAEGNNLDEASRLRRTLDSYPEERKNWLEENKSEQTIKTIIDHFNNTVNAAVEELNAVLDQS